MSTLFARAVLTAALALGANSAQAQEAVPTAQAHGYAPSTHTLRINMKTTNEQQAGILRAIHLYMDAGRQGDSTIAKQAFAATATISWSENGVLKSEPVQLLYDFFDKGALEVSYELASMDVAEDVAIVRIESQFGAAQFADMFTLVKAGHEWKIVSKVYHAK